MNVHRWLVFAGILASFWPRIISTTLFFLDDRVMWDTGNEFDVLALLFMVFPLALIWHGLGSFRHSPVYSGVVIMLAFAALIVSALPAILSARSGGLGASSKQDVEMIEWSTVAGLTAPLLLFLGVSLAIYYSARRLTNSFRAHRKCA